MWIKNGVDISRLKREIRRGLQIVDDFARELHSSLFISSTYEGNHGAGSLHYADQAFDFTRPILASTSVSQLRVKLGKDFDVVIEDDHIHVEYDPKN